MITLTGNEKPTPNKFYAKFWDSSGGYLLQRGVVVYSDVPASVEEVQAALIQRYKLRYVDIIYVCEEE